jgi:signal transduction histidine kinase
LKLSKASLVVMVGVCVVLALMTVFALELSDTQAKSRHDVQVQVHDRAVLASALIDSLFQSVQQQAPVDSQMYGTPTPSARTLDANAQQSAYLAVVDPTGQVLANSRGFTVQAQAALASSAALGLVRSGHPYGLGNYSAYGSTGVVELAVSFPTRYGTRILVTGVTPNALGTFITHELENIPGVKGAYNYLLDGNGIVLAATNPRALLGHPIAQAGAVAALRRDSADEQGTYFEQVHLTNSTWRIVLAAPDGPLFANVTGLRQTVPWLLFSAFALVALAALGLGWRVLRSADLLQAVNSRLALVNGELVTANSALERRADELARSNEELDQFASIASHDLQEPLRKVRTFTEQLSVMEADRLSEKGHDYLRRANVAAERMQRLIEDLLKFSRVSTQGRPFVQVDLAEIARDVGALPTISADPLQMQQLLQNLVANALKFHRDGVPPHVEIDAVVAGDEIQLSVRDNGIGFEPRYSLRIFRVFERLHGRGDYPGTGIGLALCRKIADRHGGTIVAYSEPGVGSSFTVTLPLQHSGEVGLILTDRAPESDIAVPDTHVHA